MKTTTNPLAILVVAILVSLICPYVAANSDYCDPFPNDITTTVVHEGDWFNITLESPACYICSEIVEWPGDVVCTPCPATSFTSNVTCGVGTFGVQFIDATSYDNSTTEYYWDFGDGNTSLEQNPINTYSFAGIFDVKFMTNNTIAGIEWSNMTGYMTARATGDTCNMSSTMYGDENGGWEIPFMLLGMGAMGIVGLLWYSNKR
jgi:PKD repeat protein